MTGFPLSVCVGLLEGGVAHVACLGEGAMEREGVLQVVGSVASLALGQFQVVPHQLLVVGMHAVLDHALGALHGALAAQVGHTLLRGDDLHGVLGVVQMRHHRDDCGDLATLLDGGAAED